MTTARFARQSSGPPKHQGYQALTFGASDVQHQLPTHDPVAPLPCSSSTGAQPSPAPASAKPSELPLSAGTRLPPLVFARRSAATSGSGSSHATASADR